MSKYPSYYSGLRLTAALLSSGQWDKTIKGSASTKTNNTLANDSELAGISLGVGTWDVRLVIFTSCAGSATPGLKTRWTFTGTWNDPTRFCHGPTAATGPAAITSVKMMGVTTNTDSAYVMAATALLTGITEISSTVTVTVAGTLALNWAQNTTNANAVSVHAGSYFDVRQLS